MGAARWTDEEVELLKKMYSNGSSKEELQAAFPKRTITAIYRKATISGISAKTPRKVHRVDLTGQKFGHWNVIGPSDKKQCGSRLWDCVCDCQMDKPEEEREHHYKQTGALKNGLVTSCNCSRKNTPLMRYHKDNKYGELNEKTMYGVSSSGDKFIFDKSDYEYISKYCWTIGTNGYFFTTKRYKDENNQTQEIRISLHRFIWEINFGKIKDGFIDHINGKRFDNRKENLRVVLQVQNSYNQGLRSTNTSGIKGVRYNSQKNKWEARINHNYKSIHLGLYDNKEDAIKARKDAEEKYFGEFNRAEKDLLNNGDTKFKDGET